MPPSKATSRACVRSAPCICLKANCIFQTGKGKNVAKQITANPKVELCAMKGDEWIRVAGTLVLDDRIEAQESMLDDYPSLRAMYTTGENGNTAVYYFTNATATISSFSHEPIVIKF